jgi:hypothetical protein
MDGSSTKLYNVLMGNPTNNAIGRNAGIKIANQNNPNFFQKKWNSLENAVGTSLSALPSLIYDNMHNNQTDTMVRDNQSKLDEIAKRYGFSDRNAAFDAMAEGNGDPNVLSKMTEELKTATASASNEMNKRAKEYEDYRKNNYISQKINQDPKKFAGSAINTESTLFDLLSMGAGIPNGVITNSLQGGIEGIADELEQNGSNYDLNRALQNAAVGAASGAATGLANKGLNNVLAKNGGNLFKGGNALTRGLNNLGSSTGVGRVASTLATGAGRGAVSGAVGGATGAGLSAAMNNQDVLGSALQGAAQGAISGAKTGAAMSGANIVTNAALNKLAPNIANAVRENQARNASYGDNTIDQFKGAWNSGDSAVAEGAKNFYTNTKNIVDNLNNRPNNANVLDANTSLTEQADAIFNKYGITSDEIPTKAPEYGSYKSRRFNAINELRDNFSDNDLAFLFTKTDDPEIKAIISDSITSPEINARLADYEDTTLNKPNLSSTTPAQDAYAEGRGSFSDALNEFIEQGGDIVRDADGNLSLATPKANQTSTTQLSQWDRIAHEGGYASYDDAIKSFMAANPNAEVNASAVLTWMDNNPGDWNPNATRTAVENVQPEAESQPELRYGESQLGNRTKRGMLADSIERFGDTLEGAQTNVTRAAAKDLGIESTGKVVENVRKKTGITNLETQAAFAKELTGGSDSLLDSIQRNALSTDENGRPYTVDTTALSKDIDSIVNQYADTNVFGSQTAREKFIRNLKTDISSYDSDVLSIANRMKATASDLRGKGVGEVPAKDKAMAKIYTEVANRLDDLSYKAIPQKNVNRMFDDAITEMRGRATQADANGNADIAKAYTRAADNLAEQPRTIKAFRTFKKDFVDASKIANLTALAENGAAVQMGRGFGSGLKRFTGTLLQRPVNTALAKIGGAANSIADRIAGDGTAVTSAPAVTNNVVDTAYNPATQVYNAIGRGEGLTNGEQARTANYLVNAVQEANTVPKAPNAGALAGDNTSVANNTSSTLYNSIYGTPTTTATQASSTGYFQPTGDYWTDILASAVSTAIDNNDETAFASLYEMYQDALSKTQANNTSTNQQKLSATQQRANAAMNSLERLSSMTPDLAYNLSNIPVIGGIATLGGNDYEAEAKSLAQQIGYMVSGSNIKDSEAEAIGKSYVPQPWDNEQVRKNKLRRAYEIINQYQNGYAE